MISRRLFLRNTAVGGVASTVVAPPADAVSNLTPDERITAALEVIEEAYREKWPGVSLRICDSSDEAKGFVMVIPGLSFLKPGETQYMRGGRVVRREGGAS